VVFGVIALLYMHNQKKIHQSDKAQPSSIPSNARSIARKVELPVIGNQIEFYQPPSMSPPKGPVAELPT
jgi:hypothetical protein